MTLSDDYNNISNSKKYYQKKQKENVSTSFTYQETSFSKKEICETLGITYETEIKMEKKYDNEYQKLIFNELLYALSKNIDKKISNIAIEEYFNLFDPGIFDDYIMNAILEIKRLYLLKNENKSEVLCYLKQHQDIINELDDSNTDYSDLSNKIALSLCELMYDITTTDMNYMLYIVENKYSLISDALAKVFKDVVDKFTFVMFKMAFGGEDE